MPAAHPVPLISWRIGKLSSVPFLKLLGVCRFVPVEAYPDLLLRTLEHLSPRKSQKPVCVLLTPGVSQQCLFRAYLSGQTDGHRNRGG